ncbi:E3 ubiquitin-protein ligase TRIM56-like [Branchiostoma floridae]|uniref:E3 ubiquitin-protein ligase TRIM56-like n=1 Tax=Branchiostoma floridae TaxID=7739 RepID=A0A9J7MQL2_BRAFL|nr:E3 ubiquitin-protein ligase TRIM56-like [Branchiostoma floridae]
MADKLVSDITREFLVCQICLDDYRQPKVLPCLHTFCRRCLERMVGNKTKICCPTCRQISTYQYENGIAGLKDNFFVGKLHDMVRNATHREEAPERRSASRAVCRSCGDMSSTTRYRDNCDDFLCQNCVGSDLRTRASPRRKMFSSTPTESKAEGTQETERTSHSLHADPDVLYCKSCHDFICRKGSLSKHRARLHSQVRETAERETSEVRALLVETEKVAALHEKRLQELNTRREVWQQQCEENIAKIEEQARRAIQTIQMERDERIKQLKRVETTKNRQLLENITAVAVSAARVRGSCTYAREVIEKGTPEEVLAVAQEVKERLKQCSKLRAPSFS